MAVRWGDIVSLLTVFFRFRVCFRFFFPFRVINRREKATAVSLVISIFTTTRPRFIFVANVYETQRDHFSSFPLAFLSLFLSVQVFFASQLVVP